MDFLSVIDENGIPVASQVFPSEDNPQNYTIIFQGIVPPLGFTTYFLQSNSTISSKKGAHSVVEEQENRK